jgi:hypothetical protein
MWNPEDVRDRWIEAVMIEWVMRVKGGPSAGNAWPSYVFTKEDRDGWDDIAKQDEVDVIRSRRPLTSADLKRWGECYFEWTMAIPVDRRTLIWRYAQCMAGNRAFSEYCDRKGIVRRTAYNRIHRVFDELTERFNKEGRPLVPADHKWTSQSRAREVESVVDAEKPRHGTSGQRAWRSEDSTDNLTSPEAIAAFEQHMAEVNEQRRKRQEARLRKSLRGVPGEQEAA